MTEAELQREVIDLAKIYGWDFRYHTHDARKSSKGFPDWVLVRPPRIIFVELKGDSNRYDLTDDQRAWVKTLMACPGVEVYVWKPQHLPNIPKILMRS